MKHLLNSAGLAALLLGAAGCSAPANDDQVASMFGGAVKKGVAGSHPLRADPAIALDQPRWDYHAFDRRPAMTYLSGGKSTFVLLCDDLNMKVVIAGLTPQQAWPQRKVAVFFGDAERSKIPDLAYDNGDTRFLIEFRMADRVLDAVRAGEAMRVAFDTQVISIPAPPALMRGDFVEKCSKPVPPGLRTG